MIDAALIQQCADPQLRPAIVEQFVAGAGSDDPVAVTIKSGGRLVLVPKPATVEEAVEIIRTHVGRASVRVGLTQMPAGIGITDPAAIDAALVDPCENLRAGTAIFAKILRIVSKWYGNPTSKEVFPQMMEDAIYAWKTGYFEGVQVFQAEDPGGSMAGVLGVEQDPRPKAGAGETSESQEQVEQQTTGADDLGKANIRVDLSRIGVAN